MDLSSQQNKPPERLPRALKEDVKSELDRLETIGVIAEVSRPTDHEWVSAFVVERKRTESFDCTWASIQGPSTRLSKGLRTQSQLLMTNNCTTLNRLCFENPS